MILKTKRYNTIVTVPRCTRKIIEKSKIDTQIPTIKAKIIDISFM
jgi:hypothetical protein